MKRLNVEFFDEFKELDNLCIDLFGEVHGKRGVTLYIETMEKMLAVAKPRSKDGYPTLGS